MWMIAALFAAVTIASCGDKKAEEGTEAEGTETEATETEATPVDTAAAATETPAE